MSTHRFSLASHLAAALVALAAASGCGPGFDAASEVKGLRVFAVQKDSPYPTPGQDVTLTMSWDDGKLVADQKRPVKLLWADCINPPSDLYAGCFAGKLGNFGDEDSSTHVVSVPSDIVATHAAAAPGTPRYGLVYSYFAACAGTFAFEVPKDGVGLPLVCKNGDEYLGADDFVVGYTSMYVFEDAEIQNKNPIIHGVEIEGTPYESAAMDPVVCVGADCVSNSLPDDVCKADPARCFDACTDDGGDKCPDIHVRPLIDPPNGDRAERDDVSALYYGRNLTEQMWINYYVVGGGKYASDTRLLNDAQRGWNNDAGAKFRAPKTPGNVTLWMVVHDNRGGVDWARIPLGIR
ncbi:MAG: hypothetical protein QM756_16170 [Polyangiaceae bacterium]